jgi:demethylmenaquinone methyltransferase/2-methoxy-6-polyprenyl-1,4-benzoquinol methylase
MIMRVRSDATDRLHRAAMVIPVGDDHDPHGDRFRVRRQSCHAKLRDMSTSPAFATDAATAAYYDRRAEEYDDWYNCTGQYADRVRPGWAEEVQQLVDLVRGLPAARTLDIACGTGYLTRHLRGFVVGVDQSAAMVRIAQSRLPDGLALVGDALQLDVADGAFDRVFTGHFYGHLPPDEREAFLTEVHRVARELVVVDAARRPGEAAEQTRQERVLNDGSRHHVYKRYFTGSQLSDELGGECLFDGEWFVAATTSWS